MSKTPSSKLAHALSSPPRKIDQLRALMAEGNWARALSLAAKFADLGSHKERIVRGHEAGAHPGFYSQLGKDPAALVQDGILALQERYSESESAKCERCRYDDADDSKAVADIFADRYQSVCADCAAKLNRIQAKLEG